MKRLAILTNFRSGGQNYYEGEVRIVQPEQAVRFCQCGWARDVADELPSAGAVDTSPKELSVSDGVHASGSDA